MHVYKHTYPLYKQKAIDIAIHGNMVLCVHMHKDRVYIHSTITKLIGVPQSSMKFSHYIAFHDILFELHKSLQNNNECNVTIRLNDNKHDDNSLILY